MITRGGERVFAPVSAASTKFQQQYLILESVQQRFESSLFDLRQLVQADLFDTELDASKELLKRGFSRAAGAIAGVVLEKHLSQVCLNHNLVVAKKNPTINDFNETLKNGDVIQILDWRFIQHLGDLRNLCDHDKKQEPSSQQVNDLINGVGKIAKTLF